ncbi:MAG TPA: hypothetical protein VNT75_25095 [Symbiobacteriaceae bacterium]|nr:hypothetical protein [Symbiobacteriaceae bacterium]
MYSTYQGELRPDILAALEILKAEAQQDDAPAEFAGLRLFGEDVMVNRNGGVKGYTYHVSNSRCDAFLVGRGKNQPELWIQPRAEFLREVGPRKLQRMQRESVEVLFSGTPQERANRVDLHVDLTGVTWEAFGLGFENGGIVLGNTTSRGKNVQTHATGDHMNAFTVGKRSGTVYLRVYDKTQELRDKRHLAALADGEFTHYLPMLWLQHGWKGQVGTDKQGKAQFQPVLRVEFEIGREALSEFLSRTGKDDGFVDSWEQGLPQLQAMWQYCLLKWFVVREPGTASQKTRWKVAEWWNKLADLPMGDGPQVTGARICQRSSNMRKLTEMAAGLAVSYAALRGVDKSQAMAGLVSLAQAGLALTDFDDKARKKARSYRARLPMVEWLREQEQRRQRRPGGAA